MKKNHFILFCILPSVIILLAVVIFPMIGAINYSLQDKSLRFLNGDYIGLQNYFEMFQDRRFINALKISLYWELITVVGSLILAIFVSIILFEYSEKKIQDFFSYYFDYAYYATKGISWINLEIYAFTSYGSNKYSSNST